MGMFPSEDIGNVVVINYDKVAFNGTVTSSNCVQKRYLISDIDLMEIDIIKANKNTADVSIYGVTTVVFSSVGQSYNSALTWHYAKYSYEEPAQGMEVQGTNHCIGVVGTTFHDSATVNMAELKKAFPSAVEIGVCVSANSWNVSVDVAALVKTVKVK